MMIPQKIHYCWFGGKPLSKLALKCIASWQKYLPNYEIIEWNESNFDVNQIPYTAQAYKCKKFAFVSDYARFLILYNNGGVYFDTDVEVIKPFDFIISQSPYMGIEKDLNNFDEKIIRDSVNPGLGMAFPQGHPFLKIMIDLYKQLSFDPSKENYDIKTITQYTSEQLLTLGWTPQKNTITKINDITIFPKSFFCPYSWTKQSVEDTTNAFSIHHYASSWLTLKQKFINKNNRYIDLFHWILRRSMKQNLKGFVRIIKERKIW